MTGADIAQAYAGGWTSPRDAKRIQVEVAERMEDQQWELEEERRCASGAVVAWLVVSGMLGLMSLLALLLLHAVGPQ